MGAQFLHLEVYSRTGARTKAGSKRPTIYDINAELMRHPEASRHIANPKPPTILYGVQPAEAIKLAEERAAKAVDNLGRKKRADSPVLVAGVVSWPFPTLQLATSTKKQYRYAAFLESVQGFLRETFGSSLKMIAEHTDEAFPHIHFFVVPELDENRHMSVASAHPGIRAREAAVKQGKSVKTADAAYCAAMKALQDDFFKCVSVKHGLTRTGPRRERLTRKEWKARQRHALELAEREQQQARNAEAYRRLVKENAKAYCVRYVNTANQNFAESQSILIQELNLLKARNAELDARNRELTDTLDRQQNLLIEHGISTGPTLGF